MADIGGFELRLLQLVYLAALLGTRRLGKDERNSEVWRRLHDLYVVLGCPASPCMDSRHERPMGQTQPKGDLR